MRAAYVTNPRSGASDRGDEVERRLRAAGVELVPVVLRRLCDRSGPLDEEGTAQALEDIGGVDRVIVAGGDGSIGPGAALAARAGVPLAVVPTGTANDFARFLGLPLELAVAVALAAAPGPRLTVAELAEADGRPFVNAASAGLSVLAAREARPYKARFGPLAYVLGALRAGLTGTPLTVGVHVDGRTAWEGRAWQVVVAVTGAFGGGSEIGGVDTDDLALDVAVVAAGSRTALVRRAFAMRRGRLVAEDGVAHLRGRHVRLELPPGAGLNLDGELLRPPPVEFRMTGAVRVVVGES